MLKDLKGHRDLLETMVLTAKMEPTEPMVRMEMLDHKDLLVTMALTVRMEPTEPMARTELMDKMVLMVTQLWLIQTMNHPATIAALVEQELTLE